MQSSSYELSTPVSESIKCKQTKFDICIKLPSHQRVADWYVIGSM